MLALLATLLPVVAHATTSNDTCATASGLTTTAFQIFEIPDGASTSGFGASVLPLGTMENDVFFAFYPPADGGYAFAVTSTRFIPRIAAYTGADCSADFLSEGTAWASEPPRDSRFLRLGGLVAGEPVLLQLGTVETDANGWGELLVGRADLAGSETCADPTIVPGTGSFTYPLMRSPVNAVTGGQNTFNRAFFRFTVPAAGTYRISTQLSSVPGELRIFDGTDCSATLLVDANDGDATLPGLAAGDELLIAVELSEDETAEAGLLEILPAQPSRGDSCDDPIALLAFGQGSAPASSTSDPTVPSNACAPGAPVLFNDLYFTFTVPAAIEFDVRARYSPFGAPDTEARLFSGSGCGGPCIDRASGLDDTVTIPASPPGTVYTLQFGSVVPLTLQQLEDLSAFADVTPRDACALNPPDALEPNDTCSLAVDLESGGYPLLHLGRGERDFYRVRVLPGDTLTVTLDPTTQDDVTTVLLRTPFSSCGPQYAGSPPSTVLAQTGVGNFFNPVSWTNSSSRIQDVILLAREVTGGFATLDCQNYGLLIEGAAPLGTIGEAYCTGTPNSTGSAGRVTAFGSSLVSNGDVTLRAFDLPVGTFGILLASMGRDADPAWNGGAGVLCLDQPIGRIQGPSGVFQSDATGQFEHPLDLTAVPLGAAALAVMPGDVLHFAAWHRDVVAGSAASNLTEGFTVWFD